MPEEYYKIFSQLAIQQAEDVKRQQLAEGMKRLLEQQGGHVEIKEVSHDEYMKQKGLQIIPQNHNEAPAAQHVLAAESLPQAAHHRAAASPALQDVHGINQAQLFQLLNSASDEKLSQAAPIQVSSYEKPSGPSAPQQKYYYQSAPVVESPRTIYQQQQYAARPKTGTRPLQDSSLEKEIAKLEGSLHQGYGQHYAQAQHQQRKQKPQHTKYQSQFEISSEETGYGQPQAAALVKEPAHYHQIQTKKEQHKYASEVERFYHQQPQAIQEHPTEQSKLQYYSTEKPSYDTSYESAPVKIVQAPNLKYQNPHQHHHHHHQHVQPQEHLHYQHSTENPLQSAELSSEIYQKALGHNSNAPSRSAIYVSQTTGAPPTHSKHYQQKQQQQHHQYQPSSEESDKSQYQSSEVRLPPINNGRPLTQEEFQALVDAGYSVTAVPVPVAVPAEEYYKNQKQQELKAQYKHQPNKRNPYSQQEQHMYKSSEEQREEQSYYRSYRSPYQSGHKIKHE